MNRIVTCQVCKRDFPTSWRKICPVCDIGANLPRVEILAGPGREPKKWGNHPDNTRFNPLANDEDFFIEPRDGGDDATVIRLETDL